MGNDIPRKKKTTPSQIQAWWILSQKSPANNGTLQTLTAPEISIVTIQSIKVELTKIIKNGVSSTLISVILAFAFLKKGAALEPAATGGVFLG